jgi:hypothetical protein
MAAWSRARAEQGAVFIHVAFGLLFLLMVGAFVVDYGAMWVARGQAQHAADAGALAGVAAISFDTPPAGQDKSWQGRWMAWHVADYNKVWAEAPGIQVQSPYDGGIPLCHDHPESCVRVDTYRDGQFSSAALPAFFGNLFGRSSQGVRAMAVAQTAPATGSNCMKPWLIPDRWDDANGNGTFDTGETYTAPTTDDPGTGWQPTDIGTELTLKAGNPNQAISPSDFYEIEDATDYEEAITGCEIIKSIGDMADALPGNRVGPTNQGVDDLLAANPDGAIVVIGMFNPAEFWAMDRQSGNFPLHITNMLAFRIDHRSGNEVVGTIVGAPSQMFTACNTPPCPTSSGLIRILRLLR